jgi:membrane-bound lytic murein transglycosylase MltF
MSRRARAWVVASLLVSMTAGAQNQPAPNANTARLQKALPSFTGDWDEIKQRGILRALVVYSRTLYFVDRGKQRGATAEILKTLEADLNAQLKTKNIQFNVVFIPVRRDELIPALLSGQGDLAAADLIVTQERQERVDFTIPFREDATEVVVTGPSGRRLSSVEDLAGETVYVRRSSTYWGHLEALSQQLVKAGKLPVKPVAVSEDLEDEDLLEMVNAGLIPTVVCDVFMARFWKQDLPNIAFEPEVAVTTPQPVAWMIRKNSPGLKAVLDRFITRQTRHGSFGSELLARYRKGAHAVHPATSGAALRRFQQTVGIFQKYASRYDLDYLLMMAQGFQESRLDQGAISPVGAVGVMQVMPETGALMRVGDIHQIDANIHAGVKYMRVVENTYFDEASLDPMEKALFTFASYNAGPARIQELRKEALKRGLDPNRWFKNVEYVVAERIGEETVTYVANIFKYYIAYQLLADAERAREGARQGLQAGPQPPAP